MSVVHRDPVGSLIVGETPPMRRLRALIARVAPSELPVLVQGPTGSGKELVARALHLMSGRSGRLVPFNACALAESMFEDALFGHVKGAFTGASTDAAGFLAEANGGTVFMDEIGELPLAPQAKLLRALETREFRPVGARHDRRSDFRVVAATNRPLAELVRSGRFRLDLLHRMSGFVVEVPALQERLEDVPLLARHLLRAVPGCPCADLTPSALTLLQQQAWPGNVRELKHVVERAVILGGEALVGREAIAEALHIARGVSAHDSNANGEARGSFARRRLEELLERCAWDTARVASQLGVHRATVYRRMKRLGIDTSRLDAAILADLAPEAVRTGSAVGAMAYSPIEHEPRPLELT